MSPALAAKRCSLPPLHASPTFYTTKTRSRHVWHSRRRPLLRSLPREDKEPDETTQTFSSDEVHDERADLHDELGIDGPALVIRSGGGRTGEAPG